MRIVIIGAGFAGIGQAIVLRRAGFTDLTILERGPSIGGTWRDNAYPGAACDVASHLYSFSFAPNPAWSQVYSPQAEILAYLEATAERFGIHDRIRTNAELAEAHWDDARRVWRLRLAGGETLAAEILISAVGQLSKPCLPDIPGLATFAGPAFHSARWRNDVTLAGRRVALIGSAASAVQIAPELAAIAARLTVFQRSPNWILPRFNRAFRPWERHLFRLPPYRLATRLGIYLYQEMFWRAFASGSRANRMATTLATWHRNRQVADPALREKLTPSYALGCKRILVTDDYFPIFNQPHVTLVTERIDAVEPSGIRTEDGTLHEADALILATGFDVANVLDGVAITGRDGMTLKQAWSNGPIAYKGVSVAGFPNLFILYGPNTNLGHSSIITMLEAQFRYVRRLLRHMRTTGAPALDIRPEAMARYNEGLQRALSRTVWATGCASWYMTSGRITANWSGSTTEFWRTMRHFRPQDYAATPA